MTIENLMFRGCNERFTLLMDLLLHKSAQLRLQKCHVNSQDCGHFMKASRLYIGTSMVHQERHTSSVAVFAQRLLSISQPLYVCVIFVLNEYFSRPPHRYGEASAPFQKTSSTCPTKGLKAAGSTTWLTPLIALRLTSAKMELSRRTVSIFFFATLTFAGQELTTHTDLPFLSNLFHAYEQVCEPLKKINYTTKVSPQSYIFCLPLIIGMVTENNAWMTDLYKGTLAMELPPSAPNGRTVIYLSTVGVEQFSVSESGTLTSDLEVAFSLSWMDSRLRWDMNTWPFQTFPAKLSIHHQLWGPLFMSKDKRNLFSPSAKVSYKEAVVRSNGNVSTTVSIRVPHVRCTSDLHRYPYDRQSCCFDFRAEPWHRLRTVVRSSSKLSSGDGDMPSSWLLESVELMPQKVSAGNGELEEYVRTCVTVLRNSAAISAELSLPMAVSAVIFLCAQLTGKWKSQVYMKLVALFIQLFAFQSLTSTTDLSSSSKLPTVYRFYNFTVAMTVLSLLQTLVLWALSRRAFNSPPPHRAVLLANMIGRYLYGWKRGTQAKDPTAQMVLVDSGDADGREWGNFIFTVHSVLSICMIFVYLFGVCLIYL
uniref:Neur_chan_LBD domain-containing protein n=1 Tax=Trichuris muris TaxID=70415 RepID=A0A5S6Q7B3_TRIMR